MKRRHRIGWFCVCFALAAWGCGDGGGSNGDGGNDGRSAAAGVPSGGSPSTGGVDQGGGAGASGAPATGGAGGAAAGSGGAGNQGGSGGEGGTPVPMCTLEPIAENFTRAWDVVPVTFSGTVTMNGAVMPDSPEVTNRGFVVLRDRRTNETLSFGVGPSGPAVVSGLVFAGTYDVSFSTREADLVALPSDAEVSLAQEVTIGNDASLEYDVRPVTVSGAVTVNGAAMPDSPEAASRGSVSFRDKQTGETTTFSTAATGPGAYSGLVFASTYDVSFWTPSGAELVGLPTDSEVRLGTDVMVTADQALNYDIRPVTVSGAVTVNGAAMPDSPEAASRGSVSFRDKQTGETTTFSTAATGPGAYSGLVFASTYDVSFWTPSGAELVGLPTDSEVRLGTDVMVTADQALNYDIRPVTVSGAVTVNGAAMPDSPEAASRGSVSFRDKQTGETTTFSTAATGPGAYSGLVFASTYDVSFWTPSGAELVGLPTDSEVQVGMDVLVTADQALNYDVRPVTVSGTVTVNGAAMPDSPEVTERGHVRFRDKQTGEATTFSIAATGPGAYSGLVFASMYDVSFSTTSDAELVGLPIDGGVRVGTNVMLAAARTLDYDVRPVAVSGSVTVNGADMPESPNVTTRGYLRMLDKLSGASYSMAVGPTGPGTFTGLVFASSYDITFGTTADADLLALPVDQWTQFEVGCLPAGSCNRALDDLSGVWELVYDQAGWGPLTVNVQQSGDSFSASFSAPLYSGTFTSITRSGNTVRMTVGLEGGCGPFGFEATLVDACVMIGRTICGGSAALPGIVGTR